ncbi:sulfite exporter TauE/SafE family protein [Pseudomaricurvus alcaniphilus]|uniref:sulfite exporter TauE/SafE family protein n=1 Tax=Pseudomaricurvus alcaniphilus TaxID=1166482 RepID=UPI00140DA61D|nr:sulfite exporter TauE/SafE family protein [Pseudomaricurvus alcaniphilus]NHN35855.1 sulfite exporter TauE/SafE family protein [Pseudomaricurvus alcaniphilus]
MEILYYILAGAGVGLAIGVTGVGGGSLMTPLLILFGFPYHVAIGTDLLYAAITKAGAMRAHQRKANVRWPIVLRLAAGSIPATLVTILLLKTVFGNADEYKHLLTTSLGIMLILTSLVLLFKTQLQQPSRDPQGWAETHKPALTVVMGVFLGVFVTLSSVGAGAIGTAILLILYPALKARHVVGTDIAHAVPLTLAAGLGHMLLLGNVDFVLLGCLLVGSLPAVSLGTRIGSSLPNRILQPILASVLMALGIKFALF